jgi:hypothetical protein
MNLAARDAAPFQNLAARRATRQRVEVEIKIKINIKIKGTVRSIRFTTFYWRAGSDGVTFWPSR